MPIVKVFLSMSFRISLLSRISFLNSRKSMMIINLLSNMLIFRKFYQKRNLTLISFLLLKSCVRYLRLSLILERVNCLTIIRSERLEVIEKIQKSDFLSEKSFLFSSQNSRHISLSKRQ